MSDCGFYVLLCCFACRFRVEILLLRFVICIGLNALFALFFSYEIFFYRFLLFFSFSLWCDF